MRRTRKSSNLKRFIMLILMALLLIIVVMIVRTQLHPFKKIDKNPTNTALKVEPLSDLSLQRFAGGLRIPTISNIVYEDTDFKPFEEFKNYLPQVYPNIYNTMDTITINNYSLVFHWKGKNPDLKPILFLSHYDVVPVVGYEDEDLYDSTEAVFRSVDTSLPQIAENQSIWESHPFSGAVVDGRIYGRGALDMKCMLFSVFEAADALINEGYQPDQDIWFAFGHDEETGGLHGAVQIAEYFKSKNMTFDAVYDEGGIIADANSALESVGVPMALVGVGEKGFLTLKLNVHGIGGHSSMPPAKSSLVYAAEIIKKLNDNQMPATIIQPIGDFLNNIGNEMSYVSRMAIANQWLMKPLLISSFSKSPASNALIRTTTAISMAKGSDAPNVLSSVSEVYVNFRILPGETVDDVKKHVENLCEGYKVDIEVVNSREPSGISPKDTKGFNIIKKNIEQLYPNAIVSSYITIGGTDAYKYQIVSDNIYRFMPIKLNQYEQRVIHNENEHITIENFTNMVWYFKEIMKNINNQ